MVTTTTELELDDEELVAEIEKLMEKVIESVNTSLDRQLAVKEVQNISDIISYQHQTGGKRLRPLLSVMCGMALGGDYEQIVEMSTICELLHTGTLYLDDIVDWDRARRGKDTAWVKFGISTALMAGFVVLMRSLKRAQMESKAMAASLHDEHSKVEAGEYPPDAMLEMYNDLVDKVFILNKDLRVLDLIIDTTDTLGIGNTEEVAKVKPLDEDQYLRVIEQKTASLFAAASQLGAIIAMQGTETVEQANQYGMAVGTLYQLCDDVVDVEKSIKQNELIGDLKNGVITMPLIHCCRMTEDDGLKKKIRQFIKDPDGDEMTPKLILAEMVKLESCEYTRDEIEILEHQAIDAIKSWPKNKYTEMLKEMPGFMARSILKEIEEDG